MMSAIAESLRVSEPHVETPSTTLGGDHWRLRQAEFAAALLDPGCSIPPGLLGPRGRPARKRFDVYRNNMVAGLTRVLRDAFPATARLVGEEFFAALARLFINAAAPSSPMLFNYGAGFADFIADFEPASALPYLPDVARLEWAWLDSYHAAEACAISPARFGQLPKDDLPRLRLRLHPSLRVVRSKFPALTIWRANTATGESGRVDLSSVGEDVLLVRPESEVELRALSPGGAAFVLSLAEGLPVLEATEAAMSDAKDFDLSFELTRLLGEGAFVAFDVAYELITCEARRQAS